MFMDFDELKQSDTTKGTFTFIAVDDFHGIPLITTIKFNNTEMSFSIEQFFDSLEVKRTLTKTKGCNNKILIMRNVNTSKIVKYCYDLLKELNEIDKMEYITSKTTSPKDYIELLNPLFDENLKVDFLSKFSLLHSKDKSIPYLYESISILGGFHFDTPRFKLNIAKGDFCLMTDFTLNQLNITSENKKDIPLQNSIFDTNKSIIWDLQNLLMSRCITKKGKVLANKHLREPLVSVKRIKKRQLSVEQICTNFELRLNIKAFLSLNINLEETILAFHALYGNDKVKSLVYSKQVSENMQEMLIRLIMFLKALDNNNFKFMKNDQFQYGKKIAQIDEELSQLKEMISKTFVFDTINEESNGKHISEMELLVNEDFDVNLNELNIEKQNIVIKIKEYVNTGIKKKIGSELFSLVKLEKTDKSTKAKGFYLKTTRKNEKMLRDKLSLFNTIETRKDGVKFTDSILKSLNEEYLVVIQNYSKTQFGILKQVIEVVLSYQHILLKLSNLLGKLDFIYGMAILSDTENYTTPMVTETIGKVLQIEKGRHPLVEINADQQFIPNSVALNKDKLLVIVTGPNTGGKSTYIKQIALITILAQIGCNVPAEKAILSVKTEIFARVGAHDIQGSGVSTFYNEMLETNILCNYSTEHSLLVIDELGRGTSIKEGFDIAQGICKFILRRKKSFTLFTTHFHELNFLKDEFKEVVMKKVICESVDGEISLLHKVVEGECEKSYGVEVAKILKFPDNLVKTANECLNKYYQE